MRYSVFDRCFMSFLVVALVVFSEAATGFLPGTAAQPSMVRCDQVRLLVGQQALTPVRTFFEKSGLNRLVSARVDRQISPKPAEQAIPSTRVAVPLIPDLSVPPAILDFNPDIPKRLSEIGRSIMNDIRVKSYPRSWTEGRYADGQYFFRISFLHVKVLIRSWGKDADTQIQVNLRKPSNSTAKRRWHYQSWIINGPHARAIDFVATRLPIAAAENKELHIALSRSA